MADSSIIVSIDCDFVTSSPCRFRRLHGQWRGGWRRMGLTLDPHCAMTDAYGPMLDHLHILGHIQKDRDSQPAAAHRRRQKAATKANMISCRQFAGSCVLIHSTALGQYQQPSPPSPTIPDHSSQSPSKRHSCHVSYPPVLDAFHAFFNRYLPILNVSGPHLPRGA